MDISIIIPSFNTKEFLKRCLNSIISSRVEVVVVDNASTDGSVEMIKEEFPKIRVICNEENFGFARAVNQGLRIASGETFLVLNSDTQIQPGIIEKLLEFERKVRPAIIGAGLINPDGSVQASVFHLPTLWRAIKEYWLGKTGEFSKYAPRGDEPVEVEAVVGGAMLISREIINKVGMLDERYFMYFEDLDYCRRARKAGFKIYCLSSAEIIHEHGASGRSLMDESNQWRRLVPSSQIYHGWLKHYLITFVIWSAEKWRKFLGLV